MTVRERFYHKFYQKSLVDIEAQSNYLKLSWTPKQVRGKPKFGQNSINAANIVDEL